MSGPNHCSEGGIPTGAVVAGSAFVHAPVGALDVRRSREGRDGRAARRPLAHAAPWRVLGNALGHRRASRRSGASQGNVGGARGGRRAPSDVGAGEGAAGLGGELAARDARETRWAARRPGSTGVCGPVAIVVPVIAGARTAAPLALARATVDVVGGVRSGDRRGPLGLAPGAIAVGVGERRSFRSPGPQPVEPPSRSAASATVAVRGMRSAERRGPLGLAPGGAALARAGIRMGECRALGASSVALAGVHSLEASPARGTVGARSVAPITLTLAVAGVRGAERAGPLALAPATLTVAVAGMRSGEARAPVVLALGASTVALAGVRTGERRGPVILAAGASALAWSTRSRRARARDVGAPSPSPGGGR